MSYHHQQTGQLYLIILAPAVLLLFVAWQVRAIPEALLLNLAVFCLLLFLTFCFRYLLIRDEGDSLTLRFGPISLFRKRFPYAQMTSVEPARSTFLDGWGIHYLPGRGWIYNLWGFDCVKIQMGKKTVRLGTDDVDGLVAHLREKIAEARA